MAKSARLRRAAVALATPAALTALAAAPTSAAPALAQTPQSAAGADLRILSPRAGDALGTNAFALDVSFQSKSGSPVLTAELWVDGVRWVRRDLDTPQVKNVLSFDVDASSLTVGRHTFVVKVILANGATSETKIALRAGSNEGVLEGSLSGPDLSFLTPGNGKKVSGVVALSLDAKQRSGQNPYVTFYVDKQFKTLKNYPPYTYNWDTTTVPNGYHTIEAMGYLDDANAATTRRIQVYVDNPGGATKVQKDVPDLKRAGQQAPTTAVSAASAVKPLAIPLPKKTGPVARTVAALPVASAVAASATPRAQVTALDLTLDTGGPVGGVLPVLPGSSPALPAPSKAARPVNTSVAVPRSVRASVVRPSVSAANRAAVTPVSFAKPSAAVATPLAAGPRVRVTAQAPVGSVRVPMVPVTRKVGKATPKAVVKPVLSSLPGLEPLGAAAKPLQVAFDGDRIAFDVQPRVEAGLPLAPFRHIFEHTGGQVMWVGETRVVRAVNADREVVISVGQKTARVNGATLQLDRAAFIEKGRTIVPLSFVGRALDVNVQYDKATGRIQITSKK